MKRLIIMFMICFTGCSEPPQKPGKLIQQKQVEATARVLVLGFDGATWTTVKPALDQGLMPNLSALMARGVHAPLKTIRPTLTPVIWTSIATGKRPEKHGIKGLLVEDPATGVKRPLSSRMIRSRTLWQILSGRDRTVSVTRWPVTWPAQPVNGELVSEYAFQKSRENRTYPARLEERVDRHFVDIRMKDIVLLTGITEDGYRQLQPEWQWKLFVLLREYNLDVFFRNVARELIGEQQRDFTSVYFYSMDALGHSFYKFGIDQAAGGDPDFSGIIPNWCWMYDQFLGQMLDIVDPATYVVICSDHGMDLAIEPQNFLVRSENDPPGGEDVIETPSVPPGPPYSTDPMSLKLQYTLPSGQHVNAPDGIFVMAGPGVRKNCRLDGVSVLDITPTLLHTMGLPVAADFDGSVKLELFEEQFTASHPIQTIDSYESPTGIPAAGSVPGENRQADEQLFDRLRALGYIK